MPAACILSTAVSLAISGIPSSRFDSRLCRPCGQGFQSLQNMVGVAPNAGNAAEEPVVALVIAHLPDVPSHHDISEEGELKSAVRRAFGGFCRSGGV